MFVTCALGDPGAPATSSEGRRSGTFDIHAHVLVPETEGLVEENFSPEKDPFVHYLGEASAAYNREHYGDIVPKMTDMRARLRDLDRMGIERQALSIAPAQYYYWTEPDLGAEVARRQNDRIAELVSEHPDRFVGLGTLPMQDVDRAVSELDRIAGDLDFRGVSINPDAEGRDYDHPVFAPFWQKAEDLGTVVVLHPNGFTDGQRLTDYYLINVIGNPLESTVAVTRLIFGGVLERHPGLKLCVVHGGGYLPFYPDRMDHAYEVRPECREHIARPPSSYLEQVHVDTVVFGDSLPRLVELVGADRLLMGTDYPYDMGVEDPVGRVTAAIGRDGAHAVLGGNAARLLDLD